MAKLTYDEVYERVSSLTELATLNDSLAGILAITKNPSGTARDLGTLISKDPALTAKLLATVNSCFYGFNRDVESIEDAIVLLGFDEVERFSLAISVIGQFSAKSRDAQALRQLWNHSLVCGVAAETAVEVYGIRSEDADGAYMAALLHDLGKAVIRQTFPEAVDAIGDQMIDNGLTEYDAENVVLDGANHCVVGAWASEQWNLPTAVVQGIQMHHNPADAPDDVALVKIINVADAVCYHVGVPAVKVKGPALQIRAQECQALPKRDEFLNAFCEHYEKKRAAIEAILG
ncbi:MAG: HDOD domain-containing protein [Nitrospiraceae bacterium]|nr:HDOD domain-containing protein [Nitrospiraceae bacterium]